MKKIKIAVVGYGNRGQVYADYSLDEPNEVEVVAVIDPNEYKLIVAKERYGLSDKNVFTNYSDFVKSGLEVDIVIFPFFRFSNTPSLGNFICNFNRITK